MLTKHYIRSITNRARGNTMEQDRQQKRVKVTDATAHRAGTKRAAIKPHKRTTAENVKQIITTYTSSLKQGSVTQTYWGTTVEKNAAVLCKNFGLAANDEPYLLLDASSGRGQAGLLLSSTGVHFADGRGGSYAMSWKELGSSTVSYKNGTLSVGQAGIASRDGQVVATLLQQIQSKVA